VKYKVVIAVGDGGRAVVLSRPDYLKWEESHPADLTPECFGDFVHDVLNEGDMDFTQMSPGVYEMEYIIRPHVCKHPECAHDEQDDDLINPKLIWTYNKVLAL
jgi:hypothetical protein